VHAGEVVAAGPGQLQLALGWRRDQFFAESLELALRLIDVAAGNADVPPGLRRWLADAAPSAVTLPDYFGSRWADIQSGGVPFYTARFAGCAAARGMPYYVLPSYLQIGWGAHAERLDMTFTGRTGWMAAALARNKVKANALFAAAQLPIPHTRIVASLDEAHRAAAELGWPVVVKPRNLDGGIGVVADVRGPESLTRAYEIASAASSPTVLVERHVPGYCYRMLLAGGRVIAVTRRLPAEVCGDGECSIAELVSAANADPRRQTVLNPLVLALSRCPRTGRRWHYAAPPMCTAAAVTRTSPT
jgi:hypothetical protein